jgi:acyl carrier protein
VEARRTDDGELLLRGSAVTRGYDGDDAANAASFVDGFFRTGDLFGRDGDLWWFRGRRDDIVKVNDLRVSPALTEAVVSSVPGVQACAVGVARRPSGTDVLIALVQGESSAEAVRVACRGVLDEHQVPKRVVFVDDVPRNAMGKVDRVRAAVMFGDVDVGAAGAVDGEAAGRDVEQRLARIWTELLDLPSVDVDQSFFDLGGDSLDAVEMLGGVERAFGVVLEPSVLLETPTVASLAQLLRRPAGGHERPPAEAPLFFAYSLAGSGLQYRRLLELLHPEVPTRTLEAPWWDGAIPRTVSIEALPTSTSQSCGTCSRAARTGWPGTRPVRPRVGDRGEAGRRRRRGRAGDRRRRSAGGRTTPPPFPRHAVPSRPREPASGRPSSLRPARSGVAAAGQRGERRDPARAGRHPRPCRRHRRSAPRGPCARLAPRLGDWDRLAHAAARYQQGMPARDLRVSLIRASRTTTSQTTSAGATSPAAGLMCGRCRGITSS